MKKLYLIDAYALIYRGYFPFSRRPRVTRKGVDTSAIYGFMLFFDEMWRRARGEYLAVVFDPKGGSFREEIYPEYKAQREATPEAISFAVPHIKEIIRAMGVMIYEVPRYEADDVIGTIAHKVASQEQLEVFMVTPDKDYGQLVTPKISILVPQKGGGYLQMGPQEVAKKHSIRSSSQLIDFLALTGDASDNVPGCKGIGPTGASKLLQEYLDIEEIYQNLDQIKGKTQEKLAQGEEMVRLSRDLVTIRRDAPVDFDLEACRRGEIDMNRIQKIFEEFEFRTLLQRMKEERISTPSLFDFAQEPSPESAPSPTPSHFATLETTPHTYRTITTHEEIQEIAKLLEKQECFSFDTETDGTNPLEAQIVGASFSWAEGEACYIPLKHDTAQSTLAPLRKVMESKEILKVGQNLKFDIEILHRYGLLPSPPLFDTMIAHYLLNPELPHNMDSMAHQLLEYRPIPISDLIDTKGSMREVPLEKIAPYAAEDADVTLRLYHQLAPKLREQGVERLFHEIEIPLMQVLIEMEEEGVRVDQEILSEVAQDLRGRLQEVEQEVFEEAGKAFNINSPKLVGEVLFEDLKLVEKPKKTKTGAYTTNEETLEKIKDRHPIVEKILKYRRLKKLLSTYVEALPSLISPTSGRIHTSYNQTIAATGRLSSSNPNLQNIPIRNDEGREIRKAFIPLRPDEEVFVSADYSQIELRLMAHLSEDPSLLEAFENEQDVHSSTASKIYKVPLQEVTHEQRRRAKTANFGIIYGISTFGLSERLNIPRQEAKELIEGYFESYPKVKAYMERCVEEARERGFVETLFGRRRYLADINSGNAVVRGYAERNAINAPIQGSAADLIKIAMIRIQERLKSLGMQSKMILQVHDELNFSVPTKELEELLNIIRSEMEGVLPSLKVPLSVEIGVGKNWFEAH